MTVLARFVRYDEFMNLLKTDDLAMIAERQDGSAHPGTGE